MQPEGTPLFQQELSLQRLFQEAIASVVACSRLANAGLGDDMGDRHRWSALEIPMKRIQQIIAGEIATISAQKRVQYVSAIAQRLAATVNEAPGAIAQELAIACSTMLASQSSNRTEEPISSPLWPRLQPHITIEATDAGWLFCSLSDAGLAVWLEAQDQICRAETTRSPADTEVQPSDAQGLNCPEQLSGAAPLPSPRRWEHNLPHGQDLIWQAQYAHARCCAVARLAADIGILSQRPEWLREKILRVNTNIDLLLITSLIDTWDHRSANHADLASPQKQRKRLEQQLRALSQHTLTFYAHYPLFGDALRHEPELAIARLNLLQFARFGLKQLLEKECGAIAPVFL